MAISADALLVGGGGGGGGGGSTYAVGGSGGSGQFVSLTGISLTPGASYPVVVGAAGVGGLADYATNGTNGGTSTFAGYSALGGTGGATFGGADPSGGAENEGGAGYSSPAKTTGGAGTSPYAYAGGNGLSVVGATSAAGGGGGGGGAGGNQTGSAGGAGGAAQSSSISGSAVDYAGGAGGSRSGGNGGAGGGAGAASGVTGNTNGASASIANRGSGGSGGSGGASGGGTTGGNGSTGVVIIRYAQFNGLGTGGTVTSVGSDYVHTFTTDGTFVAPTAGTAPTNLTPGTPTEEAIPLTWTDPPAENTRILIYRHTANNFAGASLVGAVASGTQAFTAGGLASSTTYYFWAAGMTNAGAVSSPTASVNATTAAQDSGFITPGTPTSLATTSPTDTTIGLSWVDGANTAWIHVYQNTVNNSATATLAEVALAGAQAVTIYGLSVSSTYYFWLKAVSSSGQQSAFSTGTSGATTATPGLPAQPTALTATANGARRIDLTWTDGADTDSIVVYRHTANNFAAATAIGTVLASAQAYRDEPLTASTQYFYWVLPLNENGAGTVSNGATATTTAVPDIIQQAIFDLIVEKLADITTANGYRTDIGANVIPWKVAQWGLDQMPGVSVADTSTAVEDWKMRNGTGDRGGIQRGMMQVEFAVAVASVDDDAQAAAQMENVRKAVADIYAMIKVNWRWGGYALNTTPQSHTFQIVQEEKIICGGKVTVQIEFRTLAFKADETGQTP